MVRAVVGLGESRPERLDLNVKSAHCILTPPPPFSNHPAPSSLQIHISYRAGIGRKRPQMSIMSSGHPLYYGPSAYTPYNGHNNAPLACVIACAYSIGLILCYHVVESRIGLFCSYIHTCCFVSINSTPTYSHVKISVCRLFDNSSVLQIRTIIHDHFFPSFPWRSQFVSFSVELALISIIH